MLVERNEILRPEYGKWYGDATASLVAICDEMLLVSLTERHDKSSRQR